MKRMFPSIFPILLAITGIMAFGCGSPKTGTETAQEATLADAQVKDLIAAYIQNESDDQGLFSVEDPVEGRTRRLSFGYVHETVEKADDGRYFACVDFTEATGDTLDVDFYVTPGAEGGPRVTDMVIHKINGQSRE